MSRAALLHPCDRGESGENANDVCVPSHVLNCHVGDGESDDVGVYVSRDAYHRLESFPSQARHPN